MQTEHAEAPGAFEQALRVLQSGDLSQKVTETQVLRHNWSKRPVLGHPPDSIPLSPKRPQAPTLVSPSDVPRRRLGSVEGRRALLHAVAHIEFNAIDLAVDMIARFGNNPLLPEAMRPEFVGDWIKVADDEARHFSLIRARLQSLGVDYGHFPAHNGLWEAAIATHANFAARLAIAPMVLEARGLDVTPGMINKLNKVGDRESSAILTIIYEDEIGHVATGAKWFHRITKLMGETSQTFFKSLVEEYFKGQLKPPFNHAARTLAGVPETYYT